MQDLLAKASSHDFGSLAQHGCLCCPLVPAVPTVPSATIHTGCGTTGTSAPLGPQGHLLPGPLCSPRVDPCLCQRCGSPGPMVSLTAPRTAQRTDRCPCTVTAAFPPTPPSLPSMADAQHHQEALEQQPGGHCRCFGAPRPVWVLLGATWGQAAARCSCPLVTAGWATSLWRVMDEE